MGRIRGCIVDSAPVAVPDPQVNAACNCLCCFFYSKKNILLVSRKGMKFLFLSSLHVLCYFKHV